VGVDVPNATMMVIEHAERFGLAQLHQLRRRIGRSAHGPQSLCVFIAEPTTEDGQKRMEAIGSTNDGFRIAELDLEIRGMGDFFGTRQSGLPPLHIASLPDDLELLQLAQRDAQQMIDRDPTLGEADHQRLRQLLLTQYGEALGLIDVG
jgi:ATP-dependent DNA helicase RecG